MKGRNSVEQIRYPHFPVVQALREEKMNTPPSDKWQESSRVDEVNRKRSALQRGEKRYQIKSKTQIVGLLLWSIIKRYRKVE